MSLGFVVHVDGGKQGESRLVASVGGLMTGTLLLAALEQFRDTDMASQGWLPLGCAIACAWWTIVCWRRSRARPGVLLQAMPDGRLRRRAPDGRCWDDAVFVRGWTLGGLIWLRLRLASKVDPAGVTADRRQSDLLSGTGDCRLLLARRSFDEDEWHGLRRWLVWQRRSRRREAVVG